MQLECSALWLFFLCIQPAAELPCTDPNYEENKFWSSGYRDPAPGSANTWEATGDQFITDTGLDLKGKFANLAQTFPADKAGGLKVKNNGDLEIQEKSKSEKRIPVCEMGKTFIV